MKVWSLKFWRMESLNIWKFESLKVWKFESLKVLIGAVGRCAHRGRRARPKRMKKEPAHSPWSWRYFRTTVVLASSLPSNAAASAAPCCMVRRSLRHCLILKTQGQQWYENNVMITASVLLFLSFFLVGCVVHCSSMNMAPSATLASTRATRQDPSPKNSWIIQRIFFGFVREMVWVTFLHQRAFWTAPPNHGIRATRFWFPDLRFLGGTLKYVFSKIEDKNPQT